MPNKVKSRRQFRYLEAIAHGSLQKTDMTAEQAKEMLDGQDYNSIPKKEHFDVKAPKVPKAIKPIDELKAPVFPKLKKVLVP